VPTIPFVVIRAMSSDVTDIVAKELDEGGNEELCADVITWAS